MTESTSLRLYRFMSAENALKFLETGELRVGRLRELNDPFEWLPGVTGLIDDVPEEVIADVEAKVLRDFDDHWGIICLSSEVRDPVIWSHYSDSHKGVALGFDCLDQRVLRKVNYTSQRVVIDMNEWMRGERQKGFVELLVGTKAPSWSYESEYRLVMNLEECRPSGGHYFAKVKELRLAEVVLGLKCAVSGRYVSHLLSGFSHTDVQVNRTRRSQVKFQMDITSFGHT